MKKVLVLLMALLMLTGCGSSASQQEEAPAQEEQQTADEATEEENSASLANPWTDVSSAEEAAEGAGLDGFSLVEDLTLSCGEEFDRTYRYMEGIAEANVEYPAVAMTVRKGKTEDEDISGDYNEYAHTWTQNIKGLEVTCFGNRDGDATKTIWSLEDMHYSIVVMGLGGDDDYGLSADDVASVINGLQ